MVPDPASLRVQRMLLAPFIRIQANAEHLTSNVELGDIVNSWYLIRSSAFEVKCSAFASISHPLGKKFQHPALHPLMACLVDAT
jgi:hypothetical protein